MGYGDIFSGIMRKAIEREESELKTLRKQGWNPKITDDSLRKYYEAWIWPAFLKEAMCNASCPALAFEQGGRADCSFLEDAETKATFELKPFFPASPHPQYFARILLDFKKQLRRAKETPALEHYVVLIPWGEIAEIQKWKKEQLEPRVIEENPEIKLQEIPTPPPITLNNNADGEALIIVFRVT
jgi:hypothetical protein